MTNMFPEIPGYRIDKKLGESSIAEVYLGVQEDLDRRVAIKILKPALFLDEGFKGRFLEEAQKDTKFVHPNIANLLEVGERGELRYIVMEHLPESLRDKIRRRFESETPQEVQEIQMEIERGVADFSVRKAAEKEIEDKSEDYAPLEILKQLVLALDYAHKHGVVHKNLRPENIRFREDGTALVVDFFISKVLGPDTRETLKQKGIIFGSPYYGSPEQALKKPLDSKTDIYSLGVVFYEMLTGKVPYDAPKELAIENKHIMEPVPQLPEPLKLYQPLLDQMMAKEKEKRTLGGDQLVRLIDGVALKLPGRKQKKSRETLGKPEITGEPGKPRITEITEMMEEFGELEMTEELGKPEITETPEMPKKPEILEITEIAEIPEIPGEPGTLEIMEREEIPEELEIPLERQIAQLEIKIQREERIPGQKKGGKGFLQVFKNPKILVPLGIGIAAIVIIVLVMGWLGKPPASPGVTGANGTNGTRGKTQQPAQVQPKEAGQSTKGQEGKPVNDAQFQYLFQLAKRFFDVGQYQKAQEKLEQAGKIKTTPETKQLAGQIAVKLAESQDHEAFKQALASSAVPLLEKYLELFPAGLHVAEAQEKLKQLKEREKQQEAERKRLLASFVKLRSHYTELSNEEVKSMLVARGFFEKYYNKSGDFKNHFELKIVGNDHIIIDYATGLIWHSSGSEDYMSRAKAQQWIAELSRQGYAGYSDWRLPTLEEAASLLENQESKYGLFIDPVFSRDQTYIWTGDIFEKTKGWVIDFYSGDISKVDLKYNVYVRPVCSLK